MFAYDVFIGGELNIIIFRIDIWAYDLEITPCSKPDNTRRQVS